MVERRDQLGGMVGVSWSREKKRASKWSVSTVEWFARQKTDCTLFIYLFFSESLQEQFLVSCFFSLAFELVEDWLKESESQWIDS